MKIKEVSEKTGLTKKAIRFYEQEGLFQPERQTINFRDYRDYMEKDVESLNKIVMLRNVFFPLKKYGMCWRTQRKPPGFFRVYLGG